MGNIVRLIVLLPAAALVTFGLFMLMRTLIWVDEVELEGAEERVELSINEQPEEIEARRRDTTIEDVDRVDPPPPPPQIERQAAEQPTESLAGVAGAIPEFEAPDLNSGNISFSVSDRDAQPLVRIEPQYPPRAAEREIEGECAVQFDVTPEGSPTNIEAIPGRCDSSLFERASIRAVQRWRYNPKVENGVAVARRGVQTNFIFELAE